MKKLILTFAIIGAMSFTFAGNGDVENTTKVETENYKGGKLTIKNDTGDALRVHTGSGESTMTKGASKTITCSPGKSIKVEGKVILKVTADMCGTTINLSDYL